MIRYPVVVADLDGTLFNQDHTLSPFTQETLRLLTRRGVHFIFATGRHHIDVAGIQRKMGFSSIMITANGARVHDSRGDLFFKQDIPINIVSYLLQVAKKNRSVATSAYHEAGWFMDDHLPDLEAFHQDSKFDYQLFPRSLCELPPLFKIFYLGTSEALLPLEAALNVRWGEQISVSFSHTSCLEVMAGGISKGSALERILHQKSGFLKDYSLQDCIAFGDGMNDMEMLSIVGKGCLMENAAQRLKNILPELEIIGNHREDAVARYLRSELGQTLITDTV